MVSTKVRSADRMIGAILVDAGLIKPADVEQILQYQKKSELRFGEAGVELGLLSDSSVLFALAQQFDYPYLRPGGEHAISTEVVAAYQPFGTEGERLRMLRSQLQLNWLDYSPRTALAVVSANRADGRSVLIANLAVTFAQLGQRTLLIDADMRAPRQHRLFNVENQGGVSSLLAGRMQDQVVTFVHGIPGLAVLPAGPTPPNPSELLSRPAFRRVLEQSHSSFDVVLLDTPAFASGPDAMLVARAAGTALVVAKSNVTRARQFELILQTLSDRNTRVAGSVLVDHSDQ
jgi:receptor protein-tyrosine kinase